MAASVLQRPTLVLNRNWQPIHVASVARALILVYSGTARIVDPADYQTYDWDDWSQFKPCGDEPFIRGVSLVLRAPEVITLSQYDRVPHTAVAFSRRNVFKRDRYTCQYCGRQPGSEALSIDHVVPRAAGGQSTWENCVLACIECNKRKADRSPAEAGLRLRSPPQRPAWRPLYAWNTVRIASWSRFIGEVYWNAELEK